MPRTVAHRHSRRLHVLTWTRLHMYPWRGTLHHHMCGRLGANITCTLLYVVADAGNAAYRGAPALPSDGHAPVVASTKGPKGKAVVRAKKQDKSKPDRAYGGVCCGDDYGAISFSYPALSSETAAAMQCCSRILP